jgi:hypothetical protein
MVTAATPPDPVRKTGRDDAVGDDAGRFGDRSGRKLV